MAQIYTTGPVDIWLQWPTAINSNGNTYAAPVFLGHGERAPHIEGRPYWKDIRCDLWGDAPADRLYANEEYIVSCDAVVRFNEGTVAMLQTRAATPVLPFPVSIERGRNPFGAVGTLAVTEGAAPMLLLRYPYSTKVAFGGVAAPVIPIGNQMIPGLRFFAATFEPDGSTVGASDAKKHRVTWRCIPVLYDDNVGTVPGTATFDYNVSAVPRLTRTT